MDPFLAFLLGHALGKDGDDGLGTIFEWLGILALVGVAIAAFVGLIAGLHSIGVQGVTLGRFLIIPAAVGLFGLFASWRK